MQIVLDVPFEEKSLCTNPFYVSKNGDVLRCGKCLSCLKERKRFRKVYKDVLHRELYKLDWSKKHEKDENKDKGMY